MEAARKQWGNNNQEQRFYHISTDEVFGSLDNEGLSTHAAFFDFDKDGDLDCYLLNNSYKGGFRITSIGRDQRPVRDQVGGDKFFLNDNGKFIDISENAGIYGSVIGFGLGVTVGDANDDGWMDIYVSNDFFERDYLYINNQDGTFSDIIKESTSQTSFYGMGADIADFNNDFNLDYIQVDMDARDNRRSKANMASMNIDLFWSTVNYGFHYQYMQNLSS